MAIRRNNSSRRSIWTRFWRNERGNFAMITGLLAIPIFGMVGLGIDVTRAYITENRLQSAVDNATLAAAGMRGQPVDDIKAATKKYFEVNYGDSFWAAAADPTIDVDNDGNVTVTAEATSQNYFLSVFNVKEFDLKAVAKASAQARGLEVVMVLDVTGSMRGQKVVDMKKAAKELVEILFGDRTVHDKLRIGLVPFAAGVQVDPGLARSRGWVDKEGKAKWARANFIEMDDKHRGKQNFCKYKGKKNKKGWKLNKKWSYKPSGEYDQNDRTDGPANDPSKDDTNYANGKYDNAKCNDPDVADDNFAYELFYGSDWVDSTGDHVNNREEDFLTGPAWNGCVEARPGNLMLDDTAPNKNNPDTLWVPYFYPDAPDYGSFTNNYIPNDGFSDESKNIRTAERRQKSIDKYKGKNLGSATGQYASGPFRMCVRSRITPLADNKTKVNDAINDLIADGYTHVALGTVWGWRVLSPTEPYNEGKSYDDEEWDKVLIILTDGDNTMPRDSVDSSMNINGGSEYTAYGFASQERLGPGIDTTWEMENKQNELLGDVCDNIKAVKKPGGEDAISIYTITFGNEVDTGDIRSTMVGCASDPAKNYFDARTGAQLQSAFEEIATELSKIRLVQ